MLHHFADWPSQLKALIKPFADSSYQPHEEHPFELLAERPGVGSSPA